MTRLSIEIPDDVHAKLAARATELGYASLLDYVEALLAEEIELPISEELEAELLKSLQSTALEITPAQWAQKRRRLIERYGKAKAS